MIQNVDFPSLYYYISSIIIIATHKHPEYFLAHLEFVVVDGRPTYKVTFNHSTSGHQISLFIDVTHSINYNVQVIDSLIIH